MSSSYTLYYSSRLNSNAVMQFGSQHGGVPTIGMAIPGYYQSENGVGNPEMTWYANSVPFSVNFVDNSFQKVSVVSISKN